MCLRRLIPKYTATIYENIIKRGIFQRGCSAVFDEGTTRNYKPFC
jgi:hypothetical protein